MRRLISFDIDGTLEWGDPPGWVTMDMVRHAMSLGYIVGSASDRPVGTQRMLWERCGIEVAFTVNKHRLDTIKNHFEADVYEHIGDTNMDEMYAKMHGFDFWDVAKFDAFPWMQLDPSTSH